MKIRFWSSSQFNLISRIIQIEIQWKHIDYLSISTSYINDITEWLFTIDYFHASCCAIRSYWYSSFVVSWLVWIFHLFVIWHWQIILLHWKASRHFHQVFVRLKFYSVLVCRSSVCAAFTFSFADGHTITYRSQGYENRSWWTQLPDYRWSFIWRILFMNLKRLT